MESQPTTTTKLGGYEFYRKVLGSAKHIVAPMVDQSELAYRQLTRRYGAQVVYTPMINAKMFMDPQHKGYRDVNFDIPSGEEGAFASSSSAADRPLIVQFCANSPAHLLAAAKLVAPHCDAIDINLGCPQEIARRGHYGAFLMDEWDLVYELIHTLHRQLPVPVTAKFRIFPSIERTVAYAQMLERAGAQILTCHGRTREQRGQNSGLASFEHIRAVKAAVGVPVFANGNVLFGRDVQQCLEETGADGVMSAEGILYNPAFFRGLAGGDSEEGARNAEVEEREELPLEYTNPPHADLALEYLKIVMDLKTRTNLSAVKGHLFKLLRPALVREPEWDLREQLGRIRVNPKKPTEGLAAYIRLCEEMKARMERDVHTYTDGGRIPLRTSVTTDAVTGPALLPHWLAQPYFRPLKDPEMVASATVGVKQQKRKRAQAEIGEETQAPQMAVVREDTPADAVQDEAAAVGEDGRDAVERTRLDLG